jgi:hypothetical protein
VIPNKNSKRLQAKNQVIVNEQMGMAGGSQDVGRYGFFRAAMETEWIYRRITAMAAE